MEDVFIDQKIRRQYHARRQGLFLSGFLIDFFKKHPLYMPDILHHFRIADYVDKHPACIPVIAFDDPQEPGGVFKELLAASNFHNPVDGAPSART